MKIKLLTKSNIYLGFPGGAVVKTVPSNAGAAGSTPDGGTKIPHPSVYKSVIYSRQDKEAS